jgi:hypothetical protein
VRGSDLRKKERKEKKMVTFSERPGKSFFKKNDFSSEHFTAFSE